MARALAGQKAYVHLLLGGLRDSRLRLLLEASIELGFENQFLAVVPGKLLAWLGRRLRLLKASSSTSFFITFCQLG